MNRSVTLTAAAVALAFLAAPLASAEWMAYGTYEPDSRYDDDDFLHTLKPSEYPEGKAKIYFNAYPLAYGTANPNVGAAQSQTYAASQYDWGALLGFWSDCNGDGYVGHFETAVREYPSTLLSSTQLAACPAENKIRGLAGTTIVEFRHIGRESAQDAMSILDTTAAIWGDAGLYFPHPDADENQPVSNNAPTCTAGGINGPKGSYDNVGGVLDNVGCSNGRALIPYWNDVVPGILGDQYEFSDGRWDQPGHPIGDVDTFGRDDSRENSYVQWADCSKAPIVDFGTLPGVGADMKGWGPRPPRSSPTVNTNGNVAGTYNETWESAIQNCKTSAEGDTGSDFDREFYRTLEGQSGNTGVQPFKGKTTAGFNFRYKEMSRGAVPCGPALKTQDCGVSAINQYFGTSYMGQASYWSASEANGPGAVGTFTPFRSATDTRFPEATFYTFYATVGSASLLLGDTPGGSGDYGSAFCRGQYERAGSDQYHWGWNCDKKQWNTAQDGSITYTLAYPGLSYQFRDVDCFDGTLAKDTPAAIGTRKFGDVPCWDSGLPEV